jgi:hypothetical protein
LFIVLVLLVVGMAVKTWLATGPVELAGTSELIGGVAGNK